MSTKALLSTPMGNIVFGLGICCLSLIPFAAMALPTDGSVTAGTATISHSTAKTTINQSSNKAVLEWGGFNVQANETVQFIQPSASSATLNRILDQNPSQIHGQIQANGQVFLMNGNGIIFGSGSRANAAGLFATTHSISNENFMNGNYTFNRMGNGSISNLGTITAATGGFVHLAADHIDNQGVIIANQGIVSLTSGDLLTLDFEGDGLMQFAVSGEILENLQGYDSAISNSGRIDASGGQINLTANAAVNVFNNAVNVTGMVEATNVNIQSDSIELFGEIDTGDVVDLRAMDGPIFLSVPVVLQGDDSIVVDAPLDVVVDQPVGGISADDYLVVDAPTGLTVNHGFSQGLNLGTSTSGDLIFDSGNSITINSGSSGAGVPSFETLNLGVAPISINTGGSSLSTMDISVPSSGFSIGRQMGVE